MFMNDMAILESALALHKQERGPFEVTYDGTINHLTDQLPMTPDLIIQ